MININIFSSKLHSEVYHSKICTYDKSNFNSKKKQKKNLNPEYLKLNKERLKGLKRVKEALLYEK